MSLYELEIISNIENKPYKKYDLENLSTIGIKENEPFTIKFKNNTYNKVQVVLSIDGLNVLNGEKATTEHLSKDMFLVAAQETLSIKAWQETKTGGAALVFTNANNGVALHTTGDLSSQGIIAAAVFTESAIKINYTPWWCGCCYGYCGCNKSRLYWTYPQYIGTGSISTLTVSSEAAISLNTNITSATLQAQQISTNGITNSSLTEGNSSNNVQASYFISNAAVGAGEYTEQNLKEVSGFIKPQLNEIIRVRYLFWDVLEKYLQEQKSILPNGSGFPGDKPRFSLGKTPRLNVSATQHKQEIPHYVRF